MTAPMDSADLFGMPQAYPAEDFNFQVSQVMQGFGPTAPMVASTSSSGKTSMSTSSSEAALPNAAAPSAPAPVPSVAGMLDAHALSTGAASRRRGLAYAQHVKAVAREEFKEKRRRDLEAAGEGDRTKRRKKNDTSMTERQKYRRRLQKNQDSAAAARYAQDAYLANLEAQVQAYDADMTMMGNEVRRAKAERDEYARLNAVFREHTRNLEVELQRYREAIAAHARVQQAPVVGEQPAASAQIQFDQIVDALYNGAKTPAPPAAAAQKRQVENDLLAAWTSDKYSCGTGFVGNAPAL